MYRAKYKRPYIQSLQLGLYSILKILHFLRFFCFSCWNSFFIHPFLELICGDCDGQACPWWWPCKLGAQLVVSDNFTNIVHNRQTSLDHDRCHEFYWRFEIALLFLVKSTAIAIKLQSLQRCDNEECLAALESGPYLKVRKVGQVGKLC